MYQRWVEKRITKSLTLTGFLYNEYVYSEIFHIATMYILKSSIIHLFSYIK
jgi:hypothetical protein